MLRTLPTQNRSSNFEAPLLPTVAAVSVCTVLQCTSSATSVGSFASTKFLIRRKQSMPSSFLAMHHFAVKNEIPYRSSSVLAPITSPTDARSSSSNERTVLIKNEKPTKPGQTAKFLPKYTLSKKILELFSICSFMQLVQTIAVRFSRLEETSNKNMHVKSQQYSFAGS